MTASIHGPANQIDSRFRNNLIILVLCVCVCMQGVKTEIPFYKLNRLIDKWFIAAINYSYWSQESLFSLRKEAAPSSGGTSVASVSFAGQQRGEQAVAGVGVVL